MPSEPPSPTPTLLRPPSFHPSTVTWTPGSKPRYVVINPMHIITLQDKTKTFGVRVVEKIKAFSERWFSHVLLLMFLFLYAVIGALLFQWLEAPSEISEKKSVNRTRDLVIEGLWQDARVKRQNKSDWYKEAVRKMEAYESQIEELHCSGVPPDSGKVMWTFWRSMFYSGTVFTTIGYGDMVPVTTAGRAVTIIYAFIGIPFLLMVLADLGRLFTRAIKLLLYYGTLICQTGKIKKARKMGRRATAVPVQYMTVAWNRMPYLVDQSWAKEECEEPSSSIPQKNNREASNNNESAAQTGNSKQEEDVDLEKGTQEEKSEGKEINKGAPEVECEEEEEIKPLETITDSNVDDEFNFPVSLAILLLITYMMLGAFMFTLWEEWTFFESFYFVFISMSTVGFGDLVPDHPIFMMCTFIYLLFGLALTSMCINVIQEKLSATFEMAKLRIGTKIGLDANMLIDVDGFTEKAESPEKKGDSLKERRGSKAVKNEESSPENQSDSSKQRKQDENIEKKNPMPNAVEETNLT